MASHQICDSVGFQRRPFTRLNYSLYTHRSPEIQQIDGDQALFLSRAGKPQDLATRRDAFKHPRCPDFHPRVYVSSQGEYADCIIPDRAERPTIEHDIILYETATLRLVTTVLHALLIAFSGIQPVEETGQGLGR